MISTWFGNSIDSFWLLIALQHGLFAAFVLLLASLYAAFNTLNLLRYHHDKTRWMVTAWLLSFFSYINRFYRRLFWQTTTYVFLALGMSGWARYYHLWNQQSAYNFAQPYSLKTTHEPTTPSETPV